MVVTAGDVSLPIWIMIRQGLALISKGNPFILLSEPSFPLSHLSISIQPSGHHQITQRSAGEECIKRVARDEEKIVISRGSQEGIGSTVEDVDIFHRFYTACTKSDFAGTFQPNPTFGTDHAWGGNHLVLGGAERSGIYREFPTLRFRWAGYH